MTQTNAHVTESGGLLSRLGTLPVAIGVVVALNGLYMFLVALGNITDYDTNQAFVQHVLAMDTTNFGAPAGEGLDPDVMWRSVTNTTFQNIGYIGVVLWESLTALVLLAAAVRWFGSMRTGDFAKARGLATIGLTMIILLFFGGFTTVGGEWFQMWRSTSWNGLDPAFRNAVLALFGLVLLYLPSRRED